MALTEKIANIAVRMAKHDPKPPVKPHSKMAQPHDGKKKGLVKTPMASLKGRK